MPHPATIAPRCLSREEAAAYCGVSPQAFDQWRKHGLIPGPLPGTRRWDRKAIDQALDYRSGIKPNVASNSAFEAWRRAREAQRDQQNAKEAV